jgi:hypothetical protein
MNEFSALESVSEANELIEGDTNSDSNYQRLSTILNSWAFSVLGIGELSEYDTQN